MNFYNFILDILSIFLLPISNIWFPKEQRANRRGLDLPKYKAVIWIHAASMGEVNAVKPFILKLQRELPDEKIVISTMSKTGQAAAKQISEKISCFYLPLDTQPIMYITFRALKPKLIIIAETELWPNLLLRAKKKKIPVEIINGRISKKTFKTYLRTKFFWKKLIAEVHVNAKSRSDLKRFQKIGFKDVINAGNLKFCLELENYDRATTKRELGFSAGDKIIVWGSSRPGEEALLRDISAELFEKITNLKLVIAPRHLNRVDEITEIFEQVNLTSADNSTAKINLVDEMGKLTKYYAIADLAIIGGSFFDFGGHNPLEAAFYEIPTMIGNYHHSCGDSVRILSKKKGIVISNQEKLLVDILNIFADAEKAKEIGANGKAALVKNQTSMKINLERSLEFLAR